MKKQLNLLPILFVSMMLFVGCSEKNNLDTSLSQENAQGTENVNAEVKEPESAFQVTLNGENEATFTLKHEAVSNLASVQNGDSGQILTEINVYLTSNEGDNSINICITDADFIVYEDNALSEEPIWFCSETNGNIQPKRDKDTISAKLNQIGIATLIDKYTNYRMEFYTLETGEYKLLAEGNIADIIDKSNIQSTNDIQLIFYDDNTVKVKVFGEEAKLAFYNYEKIKLQLFENSEQQAAAWKLPIIEFVAGGNSSGRGDMSAFTYTKEGNDSDGFMIYPHEMTDGGAEYNNISVVSEYGVAMKYECDGISDLIGNTTIYELYIGNELMCIGQVDDVVIEKEKEYNIDSIPDVFPTGNMDAEYLLPETDSYRVIMMEVPYLLDIPVWYERMGIYVYGANGEISEQHMATIVMLESYDEFGLLSVKTKIVYEDYVQALYAGTDSGNIILNPEPRIFEPEDSLITEELMDNFSRSELYDNPFYSQWYSYLGRFDNIKYFKEDIDAIAAYQATPIIIPITYSSNERWYLNQQRVSIFDSLQFESGKVMQSTNTIHADYTMTDDEADFEYKIITYSSSDSAGSSINYEEEAAKYNTAPEYWQDHPYASFFPELPEGVTLDYSLNTTINEENLILGTGANGCTREQAIEFISELRNIEYEELRYKAENDDEIQLVLVVEDNIFVGAYWRKDEQSMSVYALKE